MSFMEDPCYLNPSKSTNMMLCRIVTISNPLTCSRRAYYIFSGHRAGLFSVKISLPMKRCSDNQLNASFIDISRIKWLIFLLWSSFFRTTSTVANSEAPADYRPAPGRTDGVGEPRRPHTRCASGVNDSIFWERVCV